MRNLASYMMESSLGTMRWELLKNTIIGASALGITERICSEIVNARYIVYISRLGLVLILQNILNLVRRLPTSGQRGLDKYFLIGGVSLTLLKIFVTGKSFSSSFGEHPWKCY